MKSKWPFKRRNIKMNMKGMTLIEVLVAVMILSMFSIGVLTSLQTSLSLVETTDVIVHFEEVKNNTMERFQANPHMASLSGILPINHVRVDDDKYVVYYDEALETVGAPLDAAYKMIFERIKTETMLEGYQVEAAELNLVISTYQRNEDVDATTSAEIIWDIYQPTLANGVSDVGMLSLGGSPGIPGGEDIRIGKVILEVINGTIEDNGIPIGGRYELIDVVPGDMLNKYITTIEFIPNIGMNKKAKFEVKSELTDDRWEEVSEDLLIPTGFETTIRVTYTEQNSINLKFIVPGFLNEGNKNIEGTVERGTDLTGGEINTETIAKLLGRGTYESLFPEHNGFNYKDIVWKDEINGGQITYDELIDGISIYIEDPATGRQVIDLDRFADRIFVAEHPGLDVDGHSLYIRLIGFDKHHILEDTTSYFVIPGIADGSSVHVSTIAETMFGTASGITDYRTVPNAKSSIIQHRSGFGSPSTGDVSFHYGIANTNSIKMTKTEYVTIEYSPYTIDVGIYYSRDGEAEKSLGSWHTRTDHGENIATITKLSSVVGSNVETLFGPTFSFDGAFIGEQNRLGTAVTSSDVSSGIVLKYTSLPSPMYLNIKVDGSQFGKEAFTDATIANVSFESKDFTGTQLKLEEVGRTIQTTPEVNTIGKTHLLDFQYSINDGDYLTPGTPTQFGQEIKDAYDKGANNTGIIVRLQTNYSYIDVQKVVAGGATLETLGGTMITDETISNVFRGQGATFRPFEGVSTENDLTGRVTYYGTGADANLKKLLGLTMDIKFQSHATPVISGDIQIGEYTENVTLLWDVSGMDSEAKTVAESELIGGQIGLIPLGSNRYQFSYQQNGRELMRSNNIITLPDVKALNKLTLVIYRAESREAAYNFYGSWMPPITAEDAYPQIYGGSTGKEWFDLYNLKNIYKGVQTVPGSIPIEDVEIVSGLTWVPSSIDTTYQPDLELAHKSIVDHRTDGRLLSNRSDGLIYTVEDMPSNHIQYQTLKGSIQHAYETGYLLGVNNPDKYRVRAIQFDYTDLTTQYISSVTPAGGLVFGVR